MSDRHYQIELSLEGDYQVISKSRRLRELVAREGVVIAPCAYDALSARAVEYVGFELVTTTGFGVHGTMLGVPDIGWVTFNDQLTACGHMADAVNIPLMIDAEGGYGNAVNTIRTVREFEKAGVAGLFIEDQQLPPNCPMIKETRLISTEEMVGKIRAAIDARTDPDFVICARCDAPFDEAIDRMQAYLEAGADMLKPIPRSRRDLELFPQRIDAPMHLGFNAGNPRNAGLTAWDAGKMGYKIVTFPFAQLLMNASAILRVLREIKEKGTDERLVGEAISFNEYLKLVRASQFAGWDEKYLPSH